ncbi:PREDICTED: microtubule-actin cross-linking factor 1, isoforms 1/2/3/5-like isoform X46 [Branchiostoma belcheri]|uniref:Microtubule-actin cross-linking factor 1, isoforms 1/2/3/5-like isoform X46 n=1 Tax=Branchiostoma belcheri TaxID=7741 RepID=A0A6P4Y377_BRABE|nr:PREDICTED: microtubule-actin cross-linking factor 1, isoforms 1/2/3/5-like isoform X46 [Branchiostoma belcheri]
MAVEIFWTPTSPRRVRLRRSSSSKRRLEDLFRTPRTSVERMDVSGVARDLLMTVDLKDDQMVQTKCFTNWANSYLAKRNPPVTIFNLFEEMKDGINLLYLLEVLSGEELAVRKGRDMTLSDKVTNAKASLAYLEDNGVKIPAGVTPQEITNGTPPKILDLMWAIVSHYQIEEVAKMSRRTVSGLNASMAEDSMYGTMPRTSSQSTTPTKGGKFGFSGSSSSLPSLGKRKKGRDQSPGPTRKKSGKETKEAQKILLKWAQNAVDRRVVDVKDFSKSWRNGKAFSSLVHTIQPDLVDMPRLSTKSASSRMEHAFTAAERFLGIPKLIDSEDMDVERPDGRSVMTYVSLYAQAFPQAGGWTAPTPSQRDVRYLGLGSGNTSSFRRAGSARGAYNSTSSGGGQYISGVGAGEVPSVSVTEFQSVKTTEVTTYEQNTQLSSYEQNAQLVTEDSYRTSDVTSDSLYDDVMNEVGAGGTFSGQRFTGVMNGAAQDMHGDVAGDLTQSASASHAMAVKGGAYEYGQQTSQQTAKGGVGVDYGQQSYRQQTSDQMFTFDSSRGPGQSQSTSVRSSALMDDGSSPTVVMANKGDMSPIRVSINLPSYAGRRSAKGSTGGGEGPGKDEYSRGLGNIRGWLADVDKEYPKDIIVYHQDVQEHIEDLETLDTEAGKQEDKLQVLSRQVGSMSGDEAAAARSDLNDVQEEITRIRNDVSKEKNNCTRMLPYVKRFEDDTAEIDNWLSDAEKLMMSHMVDSTSAKFNQRVQNHKEFFTTRNLMRNKLSSCNSDLKKIEGLCLHNHDKTPLQTRFEDIDSRFEDGMALSLTWDDKLDDIQENWRDFDKRTDDVGSWLDKANDIMTDRDQPLDIQIARHETFFKDVDSDMMEGLVQSGERLAEDMNDPEKEQLQDQMGKIENKWKDVMYQAPIALMKLKFRKSQDLYDETINKLEKESNRELELLANPSVDREDLWNTHEGLYHREPEGFLPTAERHVSDMENYSKELVQYSVDEMSLVGPAKDHRQHFENVKREERVLCDKLKNARVSGGGQGQFPDGINGSGGGQQINIHETTNIIVNEQHTLYPQGKGGGQGSWKTRPEEIERAHRWKQFFEKKEAMLQECTNIDDTLDGEEQWEITPNNVRERDRLFERLERDLQHNRGETPELKTMGSWLEREMPHKKEDIVGDIAYVERTQDETEEHLRRARQEHEDLLTRINEFYECKERTHKCIDRAELVLRSRICQRPADIASQLDKHENAESELSNNMPKLDLMSKRGTELVQDLRSSNLWKTTEIRKEMDHTSHRWIEVSEQLHDNKDVLRNMENIWDEMYNINSDFEDWFNGPVEDLRKRLYTISDASEVPDMQRRLDLFQDEIIDRENQWTKLNNRAKRLQELNQNVPISLVERMVQRNKDGIEEAKKLAVEGRRKLDSFKANQDFGRRNLDPLQKWLDKEERLLSAQYDLQMDIYSKKAQRDKFESFSNEIASHRWKFDEVNSKAREVNLSQNPEIVRQLEQINARYSALKIECDNITKKCEGHVTDHAQYDELYEEASEWLRQQREKLKEAQRPTTDWKELEENHANINLLLLTKKRGEIKINNTSEKADVTMDNTSADGKPIIIEQVESLRHDFQLYQEELNAAKLKVEGQLEGMKPEINRSKLDASLAIEQRLDQNLSQQTISTYQYTESSKTVYGSQTIGGTGGTYGGTAQGTGGGYGGIGQGTGSGYGGIGQGTGTGYGGITQSTGSGYGGIGQSSSGGYISQTTSTSGAGGSAGGLGGGSSINQFLGGGSGHGVFDIAVSSVKKSTVTKEVGVQPSPSRQRTSTSTETMTDDLRKKVGDKVFQEIVLQPGERRTFGSGDNVVHYHNSQSEPITVKINYLVNYWE